MPETGRNRLVSNVPSRSLLKYLLHHGQAKYADWWDLRRLWNFIRSIPDNYAWNIVLCISVFINTVDAAACASTVMPVLNKIVICGDVMYTLHFIALLHEYRQLEVVYRTRSMRVGLILDAVSYIHYFFKMLQKKNRLPVDVYYYLNLFLYYLRFHRALGYLVSLTDNGLRNSVLETTIRYIYIMLVARLTTALMLIFIRHVRWGNIVADCGNSDNFRTILVNGAFDYKNLQRTRRGLLLMYMYYTNTIFLPIGSLLKTSYPIQRMETAFVTIVGGFLVSGMAVAALSQVMGKGMRSKEAFEARFRLIMTNMPSRSELSLTTLQRQSKMPRVLSDKVYTFYKMYWLKQKGATVTQLLPIFPPTLPACVYTEIYFEAHQKSPILRDLSYDFLWEISKVMTTRHYIPGDAIIKRGSMKSSIIYITFGDVEMLTAEDDDTAMLRMTRGTLVSPCGACAAAACVRAQLEIRAATFCTAHVLTMPDLWRVAAKYGRNNQQSYSIRSSFIQHLDKVKRHYYARPRVPVKYKSSIMLFKRNLVALKEARYDNGELVLSQNDYFLLVAGSYFIRNCPDSSLTEESDEICLRHTFPCILQPQSSFLFGWDIFIAGLICYIAFLYPHYLVFIQDVQLDFRFFDYVTSAVFVFDLFLHLSVGDNLEEGVPLSFKQTCSQHIVNPWYAVDFLAVLPIFEFVGDGHFAGMNKLFRIPKIFRVLRAIEEERAEHSKVLRFMSYCLMLLLTSFLCGAVMQFYNCSISYYIDSDGKCFVNNYTHYPYWAGQPNPGAYSYVTDRFAFSLYAGTSLITLTSFKAPFNFSYSLAYGVTCVVLLELAVWCHIFMRAMYSATITVTSEMKSEYNACIENVESFLINNCVDPQLRYRFINYLQLCWYTDMAYSITHQKQQITFDLPPHVQQDIVARQRNKYLLNLPFMQYLNKESLKKVSSHTRLFYTSPNEILLNTGDINNEVYVIVKGYCEVYEPDSKQKIALITTNDYFGVLECLMRCPAFYTVRAVTHVQVLSVPKKALAPVTRMTHIKMAITLIKSQPEFKNLSIHREPFLEYTMPESPPNLQRFPVLRKYVPDIAFLYPFARLGTFSVLRYIFPRYTIRPDSRYLLHYEMFRGICAFLSAMVFPSYTYLRQQWPFLDHVVTILDYTAYYDMFQRLLIGYYNAKGILIYHPASTAVNYILGAFLIDLLACLPLEYLERVSASSTWDLHKLQKVKLTQTIKILVHEYGENEIRQLLMLNRLLQLYRIGTCFEYFKIYIKRRDIITVIKSVPVIIVVINVVACLLLIHSVHIQSKPNLDPPWRVADHREFLIKNTKYAGSSSWVRLFKDVMGYNITETPWNIYLTVYYLAVYETISTGYDTLPPNNPMQVFVLAIGMLTMTMIIIYFTVHVISISSQVNQVLVNFQKNLKEMKTFMRRENLKMELQKIVLDHYEHTWDKMGGLEYQEVLKLCDQITLRTDAILHIYGPTFNKCLILFQCDISLLRVLGRAVYSMYVLDGTDIIQKDDVISDLFIVDYGGINNIDYSGGYRSITRLSRGSIFGNLNNIGTFKCPTAFTTCTNVHVLRINSVMFHSIIADFPSVKLLLKKYRGNNANFLLGSEEYHQYGSESTSDSFQTSRQKIALIKAAESDWVQYFYSSSLFFQTYLILICLLEVYMDTANAGFDINTEDYITFLYLFDAAFILKVLVYLTMPMFLEDIPAQFVFINMRNRYKKEEFLYDVLSLIPFEALSIFCGPDMWQVFAILRLNRILRLVTVYKCLQHRKLSINVNLVVHTIVTVAIWFTIYVHFATCIFFAIGKFEEYRQPGSAWYQAPDSRDCQEYYTCSLYFVLITFLHNGNPDITPRQQSEVIFTILLQIMAPVILMVCVGDFSSIIHLRSHGAFIFHGQYRELQNFLKTNRVSANLVKLVHRYSLHFWRESRGRQVPVLLETAPQFLKLKVMEAAYYYHLEEHIYFKYCEPAFLRQLVGCLTLYTYCEDLLVVKQNEITDALYFVHKGEVQESDIIAGKRTGIGVKYTAGQHFGLMQGLVRNTPFNYSYYAIRASQVLTLQLDAWEYLLFHFPKSRYAIYRNISWHPYAKAHHKPPENLRSSCKSESNTMTKNQYVHSPTSSMDSRRISTAESSVTGVTGKGGSDVSLISIKSTESLTGRSRRTKRSLSFLPDLVEDKSSLRYVPTSSDTYINIDDAEPGKKEAAELEQVLVDEQKRGTSEDASLSAYPLERPLHRVKKADGSEVEEDKSKQSENKEAEDKEK